MATLSRLTLLLLCFTALLLLWHHVLMQPSCGAAPPATSLKVMVVADLHLAGPRTAWVDRVRRESFMRSVFRNAYKRLRPDALIVLGDLSDAGRKSTDEQWDEVVARFWDLARPFKSILKKIVVGNHDVGDHHDPGFSSRVPRFERAFGRCDSSFTVNSVGFVTLNAMALNHNEPISGGASNSPVLLLHLPLFRVDENECSSVDVPRCAPWHEIEGPCLPLGSETPSEQELSHRIGIDVIPSEISARVLQAFRPRLVLNGHTHRWCDRVHADGTREVTLPSMSWRNRDDPGFLFLTFQNSSSSFTLQRCTLARESTVIFVYILWACVLSSWLVVAAFCLINRLRSKSVKPE